MDTQVLTVSTKGQIALPINMRKRLSINTGDKLVAYATKDAIILKTLKMPSKEEFEDALKQTQAWAKSVGYKQDEVNDIIKSHRANKHK